MIFSKKFRRFLFFPLFCFAIIFVISLMEHHNISFKDGIICVLFIFFIHNWLNKKYLLNQISNKYINQKKLLKNIFMHCHDLIYQKDPDSKYIDCNPYMREMLNISQTENLTGKTDFDFFPENTAEILRKYDKKVIEDKQVISFKIEKKLPEKETKIYETLLSPVIEKDNIKGIIGIMRDITQLEQLREQALIQNAQLNSILNNVPFVIYLKDLEGKIITGNKKLAENFNLPIEEIKGLKPAESFFKEIADEIQKEDAIVITEKRGISVNIKLKGEHWFNITKAPIFNSKNDVIGIIVHARNIDDEKKLEAQKETLVATLTHDLKTPTNAQTRAMNILLDESLGPLNEDQKDIIQMTLESNIYMLNMISTILETFKSDSESPILKIDSFDFVELVNTTCKEVSNLADAKKQNIILKSNIKNPIISADKLQVKRAIMNLVSNAITYGFEKTDIEVTLDEDENSTKFDIKNSARYISEENINEIFEKYKTSENARFNKASTGLGLYLSKQIIKGHKGEIHASSTKDETCIFGFSLPKTQQTTVKK